LHSWNNNKKNWHVKILIFGFFPMCYYNLKNLSYRIWSWHKKYFFKRIKSVYCWRFHFLPVTLITENRWNTQQKSIFCENFSSYSCVCQQLFICSSNDTSSEASGQNSHTLDGSEAFSSGHRSTPYIYIYIRAFVRIGWMHQLSLDFGKTLIETALLYILGTVYSTAAPIIPAFTLSFSWRSE
jgi:hypothetical protein